jgi:hypothetical protein
VSKVKELEKVIDEKDSLIKDQSKALKKSEQKQSKSLQEKVRYSIFARIVRTKQKSERIQPESLVWYGEG